MGRAEKDKVCVDSCRPGSGCLACAEVDRRLEALGVKANRASLCAKAAIKRGHVVVAGEDKTELEQVVHSEEGECGHTIRATLGDLLKQPDSANLDGENDLKNATVICKEDGCKEGRTYVTGLCVGQPNFATRTPHSHCRDCGECGIPCDCHAMSLGFRSGETPPPGDSDSSDDDGQNAGTGPGSRCNSQ
jgi:hypothetical protein